MHASALARELGIGKVVVPANASVFSAWGMIMSDLRRDYIVTRLADLEPEEAAGVEAAFRDIEAEARRQFESEGANPGDLRFRRFGTFRYQNQEHTTEIALGEADIAPGSIPAIKESFQEAYEREYTYRLDAPVEMVGLHLAATAQVGKIEMAPRAPSGKPAAAAKKPGRKVDYALEGVHDAEIYDAGLLEPGMKLAGPAIIEDPGSTAVVHPGHAAEIDGYGNIVITID